jgi:hypothetical protein
MLIQRFEYAVRRLVLVLWVLFLVICVKIQKCADLPIHAKVSTPITRRRKDKIDIFSLGTESQKGMGFEEGSENVTISL